MNLSKTFERFAGREVNVTVQERKTEYGNFEEARLGDNDPVIAELQSEADKAGLTLRVWLPGMMGTMDYRGDRLNVHIEKGADDKWRIRPGLNLG